ncbi:MAG: hypothetical protein IKA82_01250 [Clostridia bacterium]|nr:hypothetical protein [Clostridia bacterium]
MKPKIKRITALIFAAILLLSAVTLTGCSPQQVEWDSVYDPLRFLCYEDSRFLGINDIVPYDVEIKIPDIIKPHEANGEREYKDASAEKTREKKIFGEKYILEYATSIYNWVAGTAQDMYWFKANAEPATSKYQKGGVYLNRVTDEVDWFSGNLSAEYQAELDSRGESTEQECVDIATKLFKERVKNLDGYEIEVTEETEHSYEVTCTRIFEGIKNPKSRFDYATAVVRKRGGVIIEYDLIGFGYLKDAEDPTDSLLREINEAIDDKLEKLYDQRSNYCTYDGFDALELGDELDLEYVIDGAGCLGVRVTVEAHLTLTDEFFERNEGTKRTKETKDQRGLLIMFNCKPEAVRYE